MNSNTQTISTFRSSLDLDLIKKCARILGEKYPAVFNCHIIDKPQWASALHLRDRTEPYFHLIMKSPVTRTPVCWITPCPCRQSHTEMIKNIYAYFRAEEASIPEPGTAWRIIYLYLTQGQKLIS